MSTHDITPPPVLREMNLPKPVTSEELRDLTHTTYEWIQIAREDNIDISEEVENIIRTIQNAPTPDPATHTFKEVTYNQQYILRGMYLTRIIRKVTEGKIRQMAQEGREDSHIQAKHDLIVLVNDCEKWLLNCLPSKWTLGNPEPAIHRYRWIMHKMGEMREKISSRL